MKRKLGIYLLAFALLITFTACKGIEEDRDSDGSDSSPSQDSGAYDISDIPVSDTTSDYLLTDTPSTPAPSNDPINSENGIVQTAEALIGIPFAENGAAPADGFDNSGFIYYVLRENGFINCPRFTAEQAAMGTHIGYDELKSGDLAFFSATDSGAPEFGGIYIGDGRMIYSPMPEQTVKIADITSDYWKNSFVVGVSLS